MTGDEGRQVFEAMLPQEEIDRLGRECGVVQRARTRNWGMCVRARVISAGTPGGAYQADVLRSYLACEVPHGARSAFYRWFDAPLARCMAALAERALVYARAQPVDLSGPLGGGTDWYRVEATTVTVREARLEEFPGTGRSAAIKGQKVLSVGCGAPVPYHFSRAREPDSRHLTSDESWRGDGLLADLVSASLDRLRACDTHGVRCVIRLQEHWTPTVDSVARGQVTQAFVPGSALDALLEQETLRRDGQVIDADVPVGRGRHALPLRLVGGQTPPGSGVFLTHLPPRIGPRQVADLSRGRWEVELSIRLDKSGQRLEALDAARRAHTHHVKTRPQEAGTPRLEAPLPPGAWPSSWPCLGQSMAQAFAWQGTEAQRRWDQLAARLTHSGTDPTWRRRPSVLDPWRGWKRQPRARKKTSGGDVNPHHFRAAA